MDKLISSLVGVSLLASGSASAVLVAQFDVGDGPVQSGFANLTSAAPLEASQNGIALVIGDASPETRNRSGATIADDPLEAVFRDFLFTRSGDGAVPVTFSGLLPNTPYEITGYAYDSSGGNNETGFWYLGSVAPENLQHSWTSSIATLDDPGDVFQLTGTADGAGELTYLVTTNNTSRINGFEVNQVPEPSSLALLALGGLGLARRRR